MADTLTGILSRYLGAKAWISPRAKTNSHLEFYLRSEESDLIERSWNGAEFGEDELVAEDYLPDGGVAYAQISGKRVVIYVTTEGSFGQVEYNAEEGEWQPATIVPESATPGPQSNLITLTTEKGIFLVYQNEDQNLVSTALGTGEGEAGHKILAEGAVLGTPMFIAPVGEQSCLFYIHTDQYIHYENVEAEGAITQKWGNSQIADPSNVKKLATVTMSEEADAKPEVYFLEEDGSVHRVDAEGVETGAGKIEEGEFKPSNQAQCYYPPAPCCCCCRRRCCCCGRW
ncbi:hypothetical protein TWF281_002691 [Arthrobotrys megalospora]